MIMLWVFLDVGSQAPLSKYFDRISTNIETVTSADENHILPVCWVVFDLPSQKSATQHRAWNNKINTMWVTSHFLTRTLKTHAHVLWYYAWILYLCKIYMVLKGLCEVFNIIFCLSLTYRRMLMTQRIKGIHTECRLFVWKKYMYDMPSLMLVIPGLICCIAMFYIFMPVFILNMPILMHIVSSFVSDARKN